MIDNSGALAVECIGVIGKRSRIATVGDEIVCVVKEVSSRKTGDVITKTKATGKGSSSDKIVVKRGAVVRGLVARVRSPVRRPDGSFIRFDDNAVILTGKTQQPLGTSVLGVAAKECNKPKWQKVLSLIPRLV